MLDPEIQPLVDLMAAGGGPPAHEIPVAQARAAHDRETAIMSGPGEEVAEVRDVTAPGPGGPVPVRLYRPRGAAGDGALPLRDEGGPPIRFQALIYPVCDSALNTPSYREKSDGFGLSAESMARYWRLYLDGADGRRPDASPLQADLAGLPPAFLLTVADDVLRDEGEAYARALEAAGVPVTLRRYDGAVHGFFRWLAKAAIARRAVDDVATALREALA